VTASEKRFATKERPFDMDDIAQKIVDAGEAGLWSRIERSLALQMERNPDDASLLHQLGLHYRQSGQLIKATEIYSRLMILDGQDDLAILLWQVCSGNPEKGSRTVGPIEPARFILRRNFLSPDAREIMFHLFDTKYPAMEELDIGRAHDIGDTQFKIDRSMRHQFGIYCKTELQDIIQTEIMDQFPGFCDGLNVERFLPDKHVVRLDYTPHGGFGKMHQDVGFGARLSYLYYFNSQPKKFRGGDLLFFDQDRKTGQPLPHQFTRVCHEDNLLVIFPPHHFHQVTRVAAKNLPLAAADSRLSVCGFIHPKEA